MQKDAVAGLYKIPAYFNIGLGNFAFMAGT